MSMNYYLADELANKVVHLSKALNEAKDTIDILETQNQYLKDILHNLELIDLPVNSGT